jgi:ATP-dependent exoDNAse (exonuclease V) beta subunit
MKRLADSKARQLIKTALDRSMIVEAAAGTGKTTELVNRMVNVIAGGRARIEEIVAVTFTDKAAGELKLRLRSRLEEERQAARSAARRENLERAAAGLEEAHISTIHGFCADLLRERPVEAQVDPRFESLDDTAAQRLYDEAFDLWLQETLDDPPAGVRRALRRPAWEDPTSRLRAAGWELVQWQDYTAGWRRDPFARESEIDALVERLHQFAELTGSPARTNDGFYEDTRKARRMLDDLRLIEKVRERDYDGLEADFVSYISSYDDEVKKFRKPRAGYGADYKKGVSRAQVQEAHQQFLDAVEAFARSADADLAALLHSELRASIERYQTLKVHAGRLDFLDLLLRARNLIRECRPVRAEFQRRFRCIFIDEFQDTDPLQVEILLLLAASDDSVSNWREVTPEPGKLFIVGDPKQGIYRFRRADLGIYQQVKDLLAARGALCLNLTTSFRAVPSIQNAVNAAFAPLMTGDPATLQAAYVPLSPHREENGDQPTVAVLPVPEPYGASGRLTMMAVEKSLPVATAAFIDWMIRESGWKVTESERPGERVTVAARHICLLFRRLESFGQDVTREYITALEARDIPHLLVGGKSFHEREEVQTIRAALAAIEWPDDQLSVFATLKGPLFAVGDDALLAYRHAYRRLHPFRIPKEAVPPELAPIVEALQVLQSLHRNRNHRPVAETIARLLEVTRAHAGFVFWPSGGQVLANVLHVAELARQYEESGGISFRGFVDLLRTEAESGQAPEAPILEESSDGVRLMSVHKAKGLEFPVVILADITAKLARAEPSRHLDSRSGLSAVRIGGWAPVELLEHSDEEVARDRAEGVRVAYVAATRARDLLVVPAVGDDPEEQRWGAARDWWVSPLHRAIYPGGECRRSPESSPWCSGFGEDSVSARPGGAHGKAGADNVAPGMHTFSPGAAARRKSRAGYGVVWWDPGKLTLRVEPRFGIRKKDLLNEINPAIVSADIEAYESWRARRRAAIEQGAEPTIVVQTATEFAAAAKALPAGAGADEAKVALLEAGQTVERPAGPRYGALVHAVLATVPLGAKPDEVAATAALQGRILGAPREEVESATEVVCSVLRHPVMERARRSAEAGSCRRETPITLTLPDDILIEGVADIAFHENGQWTVIDFKTDRELEKRLEVHRRQVSLYAQAISIAAGQRCEAVLMRV